ncbi:MAG: ATP-binding protein [Dehalococcoidales bacterium]|nr:ATP-binding protein [Dehalococcoidales bacterium]
MHSGFLAWKTTDREASGTVATLRDEAFGYLLAGITLAYLAWHFTASILGPQELAFRVWLIVPMAVSVLWISHHLHGRHPRLAIWYFLASATVAVSGTAWLLRAPAVIFLYPPLALSGVVLLNPSAGILVGVVSIGGLGLLQATSTFAFLEPRELVGLVLGMVVTLLVASTLRRSMVMAAEWSLHSYEQALQKAQEARKHRADLVRALKQLDIAYYRLERVNAALHLARQAAERAEREKSEFANSISHELRTPLNLIVGFSEMILTSPESYDVPLPVPYRGDVNAIYRSAQHLQALTEDVLDLARVGIGRLALAPEPMRVDEVVREACGVVQEYVEAKGLWLRTSMESGLPILRADRLRVRQVLLNLLTNAARFTESGGIDLTVASDVGCVVVRVKDTGIGIPPDKLAGVFDEFEHSSPVRQARDSDLGGFGLGLPISKRLIELHGGQIGVESSHHNGTTFWFSLPVGAEDAAPGQADARLCWSRPEVRSPDRTLVLAHDDQQLARFLEHHLRGCRVLVARDGNEAVRLAKEVYASAILHDMDGSPDPALDCLPMPVLRLPLPLRSHLASLYGVVAYLLKPIQRSDLLAAIGKVSGAVGTVLLVDDDRRFTRLVARMLRDPREPSRYRILVASSGQEALGVMRDTKPDLVLLDFVMPGLGGPEVLAAMRASPNLSGVPVVVVSGQEQLSGPFPLDGRVSLTKADGLHMEEILSVLDALLSSLSPPHNQALETENAANVRAPTS